MGRQQLMWNSIMYAYLRQQGVQLHGGMGMTTEYPVGNYYHRLILVDKLLGDRETHLRNISKGRVG